MKILKSSFILFFLPILIVSFSSCSNGVETNMSDDPKDIVSEDQDTVTQSIELDTTIIERNDDIQSEEPEEVVAINDEVTQTVSPPPKPTPKPQPVVKKPVIKQTTSNTTTSNITTSKPKPPKPTPVTDVEEAPAEEEIFTSKGGNKINIRKRHLDERIIRKAVSKYNFTVKESISPPTQSGKAIFNLKGTVSGADLPSEGFVVRVFQDNVRSYHKGSHLVRMPLPVMMSKSGGHQFNTSFEFKALPGTYYYTVEYPTRSEVLHFGKFEVK